MLPNGVWLACCAVSHQLQVGQVNDSLASYLMHDTGDKAQATDSCRQSKVKHGQLNSFVNGGRTRLAHRWSLAYLQCSQSSTSSGIGECMVLVTSEQALTM